MKIIARFNSKMEADIARLALVESKILAQVSGSRDYSSHLLGTDQGVYQLLVPEDQESPARNILNAHRISIVSEIAPTMALPTPAYFKRAVLFALLAVILAPFLANYVSLRNLKFYFDSETQSQKKILWTLVILLMQLPGFAAGALLILGFVKQF